MFTPLLSKWYKEHAEGSNAEIVFASSDRDEATFKSYLGEMAWNLAVPFNDSIKAKLSSEYGVSGIPTLVTVDAKTGELISKKARDGVMGNPGAWPFRPRTTEDIVAKSTVTKDGATRPLTEVISADGLDYLMFYFSASWCKPCGAFTPKLADWYGKHQAAAKEGQKTEIVFVSADKSSGEFDAYRAKMPWAALDFDHRQEAADLNDKFDVEGIPTLVLVNAKTLEVVHTDARPLVLEAPDAFPWAPTPIALAPLLLSRINTMKTVLLFTDKAEASTDKAEAGLLAAAEKYFADGEVQFGVMNAENPMTGRIRGFLHYTGDSDSAESCRCILLDIPNGVKYEIGDTLSGLSADGAIVKGVDGVFASTVSPVPLS